MGKQWKSWETMFLDTKSLQMVSVAMKLKHACPWKKSYYQPRQHIKKHRHYFSKKGPYSQIYGFSSSQLWIWELDHKEGRGPKNRCFWIMVWRRLLRVLWTARRSNQSILKETNPEYSLKGLMLKFQYFSQNRFKETAHWTRPWAGKDWKAREEGGDRGWDV